MTHEDAGHYAKKHPKGTTADPKVVQAVKDAAQNGIVTCAAAHGVAADLDVPPAEIGTAMDLLEFRISKCQLGLFGYEPEKKVVKPAESLLPELEKALRAVAADDRLTCVSSWELADKLDIPRMKVSAACEALGFRIKPCQLGAF